MNKILDTVVGTALQPVIKSGVSSFDAVIGTFGEILLTKFENRIRKTFCFTFVDPRQDKWKVDCFYRVIGRYNDLKKGNNLEIINKKINQKESEEVSDISMNYEFSLGLHPGVHFLKYRHYDIVVSIEEIVSETKGRGGVQRSSCMYKISSFNLNDDFIETFRKEMMIARDKLLKIQKRSTDLKVYQDNYYGSRSAECQWIKVQSISRRSFDTIYLERDLKASIINTIDNFLANKEYYVENGIPYKLNILLYGQHGTGKDSIARAIASEYGKNIFYVEGGEKSQYIPESLSLNAMSFVSEKVFILSDFDRYPQYINEQELTDADIKEGKDNQAFAKMLNVMDGMNAIENRILIITTNHIEKFSPTFLRPGRIDLLAEIPYVTENVFREFTEKMYQKPIPEKIKLRKDNLSIGELQQDIIFYKLEFDEYLKKYTK